MKLNEKLSSDLREKVLAIVYKAKRYLEDAKYYYEKRGSMQSWFQ